MNGERTTTGFFHPRAKGLQRQVFANTLVILAVILSVVSFLLLVAVFWYSRRSEYNMILELHNRLEPSVARAAWQLNSDNMYGLLLTILSVEPAQIVSYSDSFMPIELHKDVSQPLAWSQCEKIVEIDLVGYTHPSFELYEGKLKTCYVSAVKASDLVASFVVWGWPVVLTSLVTAVFITRKVNKVVLAPLQDLSSHIARDRSVESYRRINAPAEADELDELIEELKVKTSDLKLERQVIERFFPEIKDAIVQVNARNEITRYNRALSQLIGHDQLMGRQITDYFPDISCAVAGTTKEVVLEDGQVLAFEASELEGNEGMIFVIRDLTEVRKEQFQEIHTSKLRALGTLSGGIAHDYNNLLGIIISNAELVANTESISDDARTNLENVIQAASRGASLSNQLLTFARRRRLQKKLVASSDVAAGVFEMIKSILGPKIEAELVVNCSKPIDIDIGLLESALMNLIVNARDAIAGGGRIELRLDIVKRCDKEYVQFSVSDDGVGIAPDILEQVRDPFFTTKSLGKGTGLGLALVSSFAEQFDGWLEIESKKGVGTNVSLFLPVHVAGELERGHKRLQLAEEADTNPAKILVVDDEPTLCKVLELVLQKNGFQVSSASSFQDVVENGLHKREFDLVVCDVQLQRQSVFDIWQLFEAEENSTPFALISGNVPEEAEHELSQIGSPFLLLKPFRNQEFVDYVHEVLAKTSLAKEPPRKNTDELRALA